MYCTLSMFQLKKNVLVCPLNLSETKVNTFSEDRIPFTLDCFPPLCKESQPMFESSKYQNISLSFGKIK